MFWVLYRVAILLFKVAYLISSFFSSKSAKGRTGRLNQKFTSKKSDEKVVQIHCASLGEYEMAVPLAEQLLKNPNVVICFSFFSPSGYDHAKLIDRSFKHYLPFDTKSDVQQFIDQLKPDLCIFIKYEFWFNYLRVLDQQSIPYGFLNLSNVHTPWWAKFQAPKNLIQKSKIIGCTNLKTKGLFHELECSPIVHSDLRYARAKSNKNAEFSVPNIYAQFLEKEIILIGSSYEEEEMIMLDIMEAFPTFNWIIAPHQVNSKRIDALSKQFPTSVRYSVKEQPQNVLLIDSIGELKYLYRYAAIAIVGGGFHGGLHNVIEAAVYDIPVLFGPKFQNDPESANLIAQQKGFSFSNADEAKAILNQLITKTNFSKQPRDTANVQHKIPTIAEDLLNFL